MRPVLFLTLLVLLCGCGMPMTRPAVGNDPAMAAKRMLAAGRHTAAAEEYLRLAKLYPKSLRLYQLRAAAAWLQAGESAEAMKLLAMTAVDADEPEAAALKTILLARLALKNAQAQDALDELAQPFSPKVSDTLEAERYLIRAEAQVALKNYLGAVRERLRLQDYLQQDAARRQNLEALWRALNSIRPERLQALRDSSDEQMRSWIELALINQAHLFKPELLQQALRSWQEQYPQHPALPVITQQMLALSRQYKLHPQEIAVLLPSSGKYQRAAHAIRDGFLAAWYAAADYQPNIQFYDANALNIRTSYQRALDNGADFIVGPLEKQAIQSLAAAGDITVPTLALNRIDEMTAVGKEGLDSKLLNLVQFGLSPDDEARQIAQRGIFDGHHQALVITPDTDWGGRLYRAFREEWAAYGGTVLEHVTYAADSGDYRTPVKRLLNIDSSERRAIILRQRLGRRLISESRLREDADMIFVAATPVAARQLVPQLRFFRAADLALYSSSHAYGGKEDPRADRDMDGVMFLDMPWLLDKGQQGSQLQEIINQHWSADTSLYRRLYALGIDAFQVIPELGRLALQQHSRHAGKTGELYMTEAGHLLRRLLWAKFAKGRPRLLDQGM